MSTRRVARVTGLLLVLALLASGCSLFGDGSYEIRAQFPATFNLFPGSPVKVLGIEVGRIKDIAISPDTDLVTVTMNVSKDVDVPADANAIVVPESLLGERFVQLDPPFTGGDRLEAGALIPVDRTSIPYEFDDVLEGLNHFVGGIDKDSLATLITNMADTLDGQGANVGKTLDAAEAAVGVLRDNDDKLIQLASRLSDLNETLNTRDQQLGKLIRDFSDLAQTLAGEKVNINDALKGLLRLTDELARLLETHREDLQTDIATITRVGRTAQRNLDQISLTILSSAELYRHADRVVDRENNFLPLLNHFGELDNEIARTLTARLQHACEGAGLPADVCSQALAPLTQIIDQICLPILPCAGDEPGGGGGLPLADGLGQIIEQAPPELGQAIVEQNQQNDTGLADALENHLRDLTGGLTDGFTGVQTDPGADTGGGQ